MTQSATTFRPGDRVGWRARANPIKLRLLDQYDLGRDALDIGAGHGWYSRTLADRGLHVIATDLAHRFDDPRVTWVKSDLEQPLDWPAQRFDTVLAWDILEHVTAEAQLLEEIARVLRPGGHLLMSVPHADDTPLAPYHLTYSHFRDRTHRREYQPDALAAKLRGVGLEPIRVSLDGGAPHLRVLEGFATTRWVARCLHGQVSAMKRMGLLAAGKGHPDVYAVARKSSREEAAS